MKIFRRSPPNREIEFTWHREREGERRERKEDRHWPPYLSIIIARHIALDLSQRVIPFVISSIVVLRSTPPFIRKRTRLGIRPDRERGKRYSRRGSIRTGRSSRNKSTPFSFFALETRVNRIAQTGAIFRCENRPMKFLIPLPPRNSASPFATRPIETG